MLLQGSGTFLRKHMSENIALYNDIRQKRTAFCWAFLGKKDSKETYLLQVGPKRIARTFSFATVV